MTHREPAEWAGTYRAMFGFVPDPIAQRIDVSAELDPDFLDALETFRARAMYHPGLDERTKQLLAFALLLSHGRPAALNHLIGARRAGASWQEVVAAAEIVSAIGAMGPANQIGRLINEARAAEAREETGGAGG
jgi:alkylhydroperoxidase/carboxymuconolactone decarboxylase family protein YurZ